MDVIQKCAERLIKEKIIEEKDNIVIGLSGGGDSVGLFEALILVRQKVDFCLTAVHVHHGIRAESADRDMNYCQRLCNDKNVDLITVRVSVPELADREGISEELAGRRVRKEAFIKALRKGKGKAKLFLAHHANDQEETVFMNLLRGTGLAGLSGMRLRQYSVEEDFEYETIRPFLEYEHREILEALSERNITWCEDETNSEDIYTRNAIRLNILPQIKALYPGFTNTVGRMSQLMADSSDYIIGEAKNFLKKNSELENGNLFVNVENLKRAHIALKREVIRQAVLMTGGLVDVSFAQVEEILSLLDLQSGRCVNIDRGRCVRRSFNNIVFEGGKLIIEETELIIEEEKCSAEEVLKKLVNNSHKDYAKWFDCDKIKSKFLGDIEVRKPEEDDYLIIDKDGHTKKLSLYLKQQKVDLRKRDKINVAAAGHIILAVEGMRDSCGFEVDKNTRKIIKIYSRGKIQ